MAVIERYIPARIYLGRDGEETLGVSHGVTCRKVPFAVRKRADGTFKWHRGEGEVHIRTSADRRALDRLAHRTKARPGPTVIIRKTTGETVKVFRSN